MTQSKAKDPYKSSRVLYIFEALVEFLTATLVAGTFLATLTSELGISDAVTGVISSFVTLGCGFQMISVFISRKNGVKKKVIFFAMVSEVLFALIYVAPFIDISYEAKTAIFIICQMAANILLNAGNPLKISWYMSLVDDSKRGIFTSFKQMVSLGGGMAFSLIMGKVIDYYKSIGEIRKGLIISAITLCVLMVIHGLTLILSKEKPTVEEKAEEPIMVRFGSLFKNKKYLLAVVLCVLWNVSQQIITPFLGTYQIKELGFSLTTSATIAMVYSVVRILFEPVMGKFADKRSFAASFRLCIVFMIGATVMLILAPIKAAPFYIAFNVLRGICGAGVNSALMNIVFDYVPHESRSDALAVKSTAYGFIGFFTALAAAPVVEKIQSVGGINMFGINFCAQQILSMVSIALLIFLAIFIGKVIMKKKQ